MGEDEMMPSDEEMSTVDHIRQAIEHLKQAFDLDDDDARGAQTIGSLASLQKILGGEQQKDQKLSQALGA
jgi:Ca2+-binding EF-hand superfamily protein